MVTSYLQTVRGFDRNVRLYLFATALMGFTYDGGIYSVIFNLYLLRLGLGPAFVGLINSAGMLAFALSALPAGALGERWGDRRLMLLGLCAMFGGSLALTWAEFGPVEWRGAWLILSYVVLNAGLACYFVNSVPYLMKITGPNERSAAFSVQSALISLAAFFGSLTAGFLPGFFAISLGQTLDQPAPYRIPLWLASLLFTFGFWALITSRPPAAPAEEFPVASAGSVASASRSVWWLIGGLTVVRMLLVCGSAVAMTFFNVYMDNGLEIPTAQIGIAISLGRLSAVPAALLTPLLAARLGNVQVTALASLGIALFLVPMALLPVWYAAAMGYVGVIALTSVRYPAFMVYTMEIVPAKYRATLTGAGEMAVGLSFAVLAFAGGFIITTGGYGPLFLLGAALNLVGTAALLAFAARLQRTRRYTPVLEQ